MERMERDYDKANTERKNKNFTSNGMNIKVIILWDMNPYTMKNER